MVVHVTLTAQQEATLGRVRQAVAPDRSLQEFLRDAFLDHCREVLGAARSDEQRAG